MELNKFGQEGLISVIVPVYNVKTYLDECIQSILNQTYKKLEIILVDDGSTDGSGELCDSYAQVDSRINIIHKENGGLSDARNKGMEVATGEYIGFVDADDYIESNMYEVLVNAAKEKDAVLVSARYKYSGDRKDTTPGETGAVNSIESVDFLSHLISQDGIIVTSYSVWDRLYKRSLISSLRFPKGLCYEDIVFSTKAILDAKKVIYVDKKLYNYRVRNDSISQGHELRYDKRLITDRYPLQKEQVEWLTDSGYAKIAKLAKATYYSEYLILLSMESYPEYKNTLFDALKYMHLRMSDIITLNVGVKAKVGLLIKMLFPMLVVKEYRKKDIKI